MFTPRCFALAAAVLTMAALPPRAAYASDPTASELQAARTLFAGAERDEDEGRWNEALDKLHKVATVKMTAGVRFHIALCEENLGHLAIALAEYTAAEALAQREKNREVLDSLRAPLASLRARVPELTIVTPRDVGYVEVALDGHVLAQGVLGVPLPVDPGTHRVEARASGRVPFAASIVLAEREQVSLEVRLPEEPRGPAKGAAVALAPASPFASSASSASAPSRRLAPVSGERAGDDTQARGVLVSTSSPPRRLRAAPIAATAGALALAGGGVAFFVLAGDAERDARASCRVRTEACEDSMKTPTRTLDALALGSWIGAGALTALAVVLWTRPSSTSPTTGSAPRARGALVVGPSSIGLAGSF